MKKYLNGYKAPMFYCWSAQGIFSKIILDLKYQALKEFMEDFYIESETLLGEFCQEYSHSIMSWELDYSALIESPELKKLKLAIDHTKHGGRVVMFPHQEVARSYDIKCMTKSFTLNTHYGGINSPGHKDFTVKFQCPNPVNDWNWIDPNDIVYFGTAVSRPEGFLIT